MLIPSTIAIVKGVLIVKVVPLPSELLTITYPQVTSIFSEKTFMPTPLPENSVTASFVENPVKNIRMIYLYNLRSKHLLSYALIISFCLTLSIYSFE